jgi:hypothetical protein
MILLILFGVLIVSFVIFVTTMLILYKSCPHCGYYYDRWGSSCDNCGIDDGKLQKKKE